MALPRLTGALRAFGEVSAEDGYDALPSLEEELAWKRRVRAQKLAEEGLSWQKLAQTVQKHSKVGTHDTIAALRELTHVTREIGLYLYIVLPITRCSITRDPA
jgi:hypothetical protein